MGDTEDNTRYPHNQYGVNEGYGSLHRQKLPVRNPSYPQPLGDQYVDDDDDNGDGDDDDEGVEQVDEEEEEDDENDDDNDHNGIQQMPKVGDDDDDDNDEDDEVDDDDDDDDGGEEDGDDGDEEDKQRNYNTRVEDADIERRQKKRKLKSLLSSYEFAPRVPAPPVVVASSTPKPSFGRRNLLTDWTEHETFILLDAWGDRFIQRGRKSIRSEEWQEVAEKVSQKSKIGRTETQCRNRVDTLKKKYKKSKMKLGEIVGGTCNWVYFQKMDMLMASSPQQSGLSCGVDSGEYVFTNPRVCTNRKNGLEERRDSPGNSESAEGKGYDSDGLPPKRTRIGGSKDDGASFRLVADSIQKFSDIYEKIENSKRQQMLELEKMRMDFHRELELQKWKILERAQAEIAKIRRQHDDENDVSAGNVSG